MSEQQVDIEEILNSRHDNGADYWATPDGRIYVGNPFSTIGALNLLHELELTNEHEAVRGGLDQILAACREDGRIRVGPKSPMYPCYTAEAARVLCRYGLNDHSAVRRTVTYLLESTPDSGGWRCSFTKFGRGPETACANPGATLNALDVLRHFGDHEEHPAVTAAVESLLRHWETRAPAGPCHWGIGNQCMLVEYPFLRYNLFYYVYVLSFFSRASRDLRLLEALGALEARLDDQGRVVVDRPHRRFKHLRFCAKGAPSIKATKRYRELRRNLEGGSRHAS